MPQRSKESIESRGSHPGMASTVMLVSITMAIVVFCAVQDRATAAGVRRYIDQQQSSATRGRRGASIDQIMKPAVRQSVRQGAAWGSVVLAIGTGAAGMLRWSARRG